MSGMYQRAKYIFLDAIELPDNKQRLAFVANQCADNVDLRAEVNRLLDNHEKLGAFLATASSADTTAENTLLEQPGTQIGPYKLLHEIGQGGMGVVYMAEQKTPVERLVALKIIRPGMDSRQIIARFEFERHALAMMEHVNIARVLDAGATASKQLYVVMELVHGVPITKHCDENRLTLRQRLELFVPVCQAVQHAHKKGIIHRDIKPSNVLVTVRDGIAIPKVIDFGVAKATEPQPNEGTLFTQFGTMVGTLEYMSPEQAETSHLGVDTRSDIYSLGVLLYELLTGSTPLRNGRIKGLPYTEVLRLIKDEEPPKPSARLSDSDPSLSAISEQRGLELAKLTRLVRGELDWITMKTLEKDRDRRYETANSLVADLQRFLNDEPVLACSPSAMYRFRKFVKRNRAAFALATTAMTGLIVALVLFGRSNHLIRQEQARTSDQRDRAERALNLAERRADENRASLERLRTASALIERAKMFDANQQWDDAAAAYTKAIDLRPDHAPAWEGRGEMYARLGLWELATADLTAGAERQESNHSGHWFHIALAHVYNGDLARYRALYSRMNERFEGIGYANILTDQVRIGTLLPNPPKDANRFVELATVAVAGEPNSPWNHQALGIARYRAGEYELAIKAFRDSPAGDANWNERPINYPFLAMALYRLGLQDEARQALQEVASAIDGWTDARFQGAERNWVITQGATAHWPVPWWSWMVCQVYYREARELMDLPTPPEDPRIHVLRGRSLAGLRRSTEAEVEYAAAVALWPDNRQVRLEAHRNAGYSAIGRRQWSRAAIEFTRASELVPDDASLWRFRAMALLGAGELDEYRRTCQDMLLRFESTTDARVAGNVVLACVVRGDAVPDVARLLPLARVALPWGHSGAHSLGKVLYRVGRDEEAIKSIEEAAKTFRPGAFELSFLAMAHHRLGHADEARECLERTACWIDEANRPDIGNLNGSRAAWGGWSDPVYCDSLHREAEALLGS